MDTQGRVLRFDSFSKILVPGARLGFVTGARVCVGSWTLSKMTTGMDMSAAFQVQSFTIRRWPMYEWHLINGCVLCNCAEAFLKAITSFGRLDFALGVLKQLDAMP